MSIQCHACIGGTNVGEDIRKLDYGQHVVSGTPGRVFGKLFMGLFPTCQFFFQVQLVHVHFCFLLMHPKGLLYIVL